MLKSLKMSWFLLVMGFTINAYAVDCTPSGAYAQGYNEARSNYPMQSNYASLCPGSPSALNWNYIRGYKAGARAPYNPNPPVQPPVQPQQCVSSLGGVKACGYHCVSSAFNAMCAASPDQTCMADQMGHIACGYHCAATMGDVKCSTDSSHSCRADPFSGKVSCQ